jgi:hypothetical protein
MDEGSVCVANVTRSGRVRRAVMGSLVLAGTGAALLALSHGVLTNWALLAVPPVAFGWLCVVQALENT